MKQLPSVDIFGVTVNPLGMEDAVEWAAEVIRGSGLHHVVTPNTEMIVKARKDSRVRTALNAAQLHLPDSVGVVWAIKSLQKTSSQRVTGVDFSQKLCELANERGLTVGLIGRKDGLYPNNANQAATKLAKSYPRAKFKAFMRGGEAASMNEFIGVNILLVGLGAPSQDIWIEQNRTVIGGSGVKIAAGIGASIDFMAGLQRRAPQRVQKLKLEWLWRLVHQPSRIKRQMSIPYFMVLVLAAKLHLIKK